MIDVKFGTIFGANVGFELLTRKDFEGIDHDALWSLMINLFAFRISVVKWPNEE